MLNNHLALPGPDWAQNYVGSSFGQSYGLLLLG